MAAGKELTDRQHLVRIGGTTIVLSLIGMALVYFVWGPHMPPGNDSVQAKGQQFDNTVLATVAVPVMVFIWVYMAYVLIFWRAPVDTPVAELVDGPHIKGNRAFQTSWMAITGLTVLSLFVFGTYELVKDHGSGTGSGQSPIWTPAGYTSDTSKSNLLVVQVIGQQWRWTFRYPQYSGLESSELVVPVGTEVQYAVTSLDVLHSFWAVNWGIKADAVPGVNNIAFGNVSKVGSVDIRCVELCGIWHGAMFTTGRAVSSADFHTWIGGELAKHSDLIKFLPDYADFYLPQADGGYYDPSANPVPAPSGATPPASPTVIP